MVDALRKLALEQGLAALGVAPATEEVAEEFAWARSVVVVAACYLPPERARPDDAPRGWIARVARGADYHDVLRDAMRPIAEHVRASKSDARAEICVDTCSLPERKLAVLAGIARRGKSGNVFVDGCGSYAALGEIVTDVDLPHSSRALDSLCGECDICVRSCPAKAIIAPYTVDTTRCISALTQMSGLIPREMRPLMGNHIYGCDTCQEVCPGNAEVRACSSAFAKESFPEAYPELVPLIRMSAKEYRETLKDSPIGWIRRTRIRRNAAIAAGNLKREEAVEALAEMLRDENPMLRATATWAMGEIGSPDSVSALQSALQRERDETVVEEIRTALKRMRN